MKTPQLALLLAAAVTAGALGLIAGSRWSPEQTKRELGLGATAPAVSLPDRDGRLHRFEVHRGRPLLVNYWASWCGPCIEEMPLLDVFAAAQGANGVQVVGIALDEPAAVAAFLQRTPVRYPVWFETAGPADSSVRMGNVQGVLPFSVLIDAQGRVAARKTGPFTAAELERFARP